jgi:protein-S-isoprenylcysteine O-methyltransferase Ste14
VADTLALLARWRVRIGFLAGLVTLVLARPTWTTWSWGLAVALAGELVRVWAAGHLEKGREVTRSGPYRWTRHPLYVGSAIMAVGVVMASWHPVVAAVAAVYMASTLTAAVRTEEAHLRTAFGDTYDRYRASIAEPMTRAFSVERALRNREHRAAVGLLVGFALLALKVRAPI